MSDFIVVKERHNINVTKNLDVPSFEYLNKDPALIYNLYTVQGIINRSIQGASVIDLKKTIDLIKFIPSGKASGMGATIDVTGLKQENGTIDLVINANVSYTPGYDSNNDSIERRSFYQDFVRFDIQPTESNLWNIAQATTLPSTNQNEVTYSIQTGWSATAGLTVSEKPNFSASGTYSFQTSATTTTKDFNIRRETISTRHYICWTSSMKNCYEGNNGSAYDVTDPYSLASSSPLTRWLKSVPDVARSDFSIGYQATYYSIDPGILNKVAHFDIVTVQHLIHGEIFKRVGPSFARMGGEAIMYPSYLVNKAQIVIDFPNRKVSIGPIATNAYGLKDIMDEKSEINAILNK